MVEFYRFKFTGDDIVIFTVLKYQYRDAGNYKAYGELLIEGEFTNGDLEALAPYLYDGEYFVPEEVGIPPLQPLLCEDFGGPNENDHDWHAFECPRQSHSEDMKMPVWGTKAELIQRFRDKNRKRKTCKR